jgi:superfamily II DNA or RNA helicase
MPVSFKGRLIQFAGRLHRQSKDGKEIRIYDYVDLNSGLTISMFKKRIAAYKKMRYKFECNSMKLNRWLN